MVVTDWETEEDNPVEGKYRKMAHDLLRGLVDPELKPNREERERLDALINSPALGDHLKMEEKDLLWKFRHCLTDSEKAVTKFLLSVDWSVEQEVAQVDALLAQWQQRAPIDVSDALKLLGREKAFQAEVVRRFAVEALRSASDEELLAYMLQLVQALRYEPARVPPPPPPPGQLAPPPPQQGDAEPAPLTPLAAFLVERACGSFHLASFLYWYLKGGPVPQVRGRERYPAPAAECMCTVPLGRLRSPPDHAQEGYIGRVAEAQRLARDEKGRKEAKESRLRQLLQEPQLARVGAYLRRDGAALPMPLDPGVQVTGLNPQSAFMFRSALYPCVVEFIVGEDRGAAAAQLDRSGSGSSGGGRRGAHAPAAAASADKVLFKSGDDLRQDQLVIQMVSLMDGLLKRVNLDLKLRPYRILATGPKDGLVEFVAGSLPISQVLATFGNSILDYLRHHNPDAAGPMGVARDAVLTFVKSCAGYCVITYILGIGDRHLDNLMLLPEGNLFHIDFGYIFGRDPKPMAPPFRLTREMADGTRCCCCCRRRSCCAYTWLRKSAHLILNLLNLMVDAGIESLSTDPVAVLGRVAERFRLDLSDEQADHFFLSLIDESLFAFAPRVMEVMHKIGVSRR
ncbi:kinase-like domain-containing protein [Tribonema minus]|uniref:phosphatidylinositol 3-kinase n=1 Tax=Tribonema minus TaxID=303371 RepID=A0A836CGT8_9STRA|nr:kinase-like domain-containing protein [Tribonema minus]